MSIYLDTANKQIKKGIVGLDTIKSNLAKHYLELDKQEWIETKQAEYDKLFPMYKASEKIQYETLEEFQEGYLGYQESEIYDASGSELWITLKVEIDYSEDENYVTFEEYKNETRVVSEAVYFTYEEYSESFNSEFEAMMTEEEYNNNPIIATEEVTELVRPYIPNDVSGLVDEYLKKSAPERINKEYEEKVANLTKGIPSTERSTWNKQEIEARAYLADNNADVPFIKTLAESRGVPLDYLANKIIEKADIFSVELGKLTGEKQRKEDLLKG